MAQNYTVAQSFFFYTIVLFYTLFWLEAKQVLKVMVLFDSDSKYGFFKLAVVWRCSMLGWGSHLAHAHTFIFKLIPTWWYNIHVFCVCCQPAVYYILIHLYCIKLHNCRNWSASAAHTGTYTPNDRESRSAFISLTNGKSTTYWLITVNTYWPFIIFYIHTVRAFCEYTYSYCVSECVLFVLHFNFITKLYMCVLSIMMIFMKKKKKQKKIPILDRQTVKSSKISRPWSKNGNLPLAVAILNLFLLLLQYTPHRASFLSIIENTSNLSVHLFHLIILLILFCLREQFIPG